MMNTNPESHPVVGTNDKDEMLRELRAIREALDVDASINAEAAARFLGMGEKQLNTLIKSGMGPKFYDMPVGRRFTRRELIAWREEKFGQQVQWYKKTG